LTATGVEWAMVGLRLTVVEKTALRRRFFMH